MDTDEHRGMADFYFFEIRKIEWVIFSGESGELRVESGDIDICDSAFDRRFLAGVYVGFIY
jgi:hypothetical protein